jgi:CheY-like chemotaxis protein
MPRIMIVEDNEFSRDALTRRLLRRGFDVVSANDGLQALSVAHETLPDLILMDLGLPGIDGWEATRRLKADSATSRIPIIVLSAHAMAADRDQALSAGGDDFDTKPVRFERLFDKMQALLASTSLGTGSSTVIA